MSHRQASTDQGQEPDGPGVVPVVSSPDPPPHATRRLLVVLGALSAIGPLSFDLYLPALPQLTAELHGTDAQGQLTLSGCLLGMALGQLLIGPWSDRVGRRPPLLIGLAVYIGASLACALAPSMPVLIAVRVLQGLGGAAGIVISRAVVRDLWRGNEIARALAWLMLISSFAPMTAPLIGGQLVRYLNWRELFGVIVFASVLLLVLAWRAVPESSALREGAAGHRRDMRRSGIRSVLREPVFAICAAVLALVGGASFTYISVSSFVLQGQYGLTPQQFSLVFSLNAIGSISCGYLNARLLRRINPGTMLAAGSAVAVLGSMTCLLVAVTHAPAAALIPVLFVTVGTTSWIVPNATAIAMRRHADAAGAASAVIGTGGFLFGALVAPLASFGGTATALSMTGLMVVLQGTAWVLIQFALVRASRSWRA